MVRYGVVMTTRTEYQQRWFKKNPAAYRANYQLNNAVKLGKIIRPDSCEVCETPGAVQGHHSDYSKPLEVRWLCRSCHNNNKFSCTYLLR